MSDAVVTYQYAWYMMWLEPGTTVTDFIILTNVTPLRQQQVGHDGLVDLVYLLVV